MSEKPHFNYEASSMVPQEIHEAARKVGNWFKINQIKEWEFYDLADRWHHRPPPPQGGQPAEPVEGVTALEEAAFHNELNGEAIMIVREHLKSVGIESAFVDDAAKMAADEIRRLRAEAANRTDELRLAYMAATDAHDWDQMFCDELVKAGIATKCDKHDKNCIPHIIAEIVKKLKDAEAANRRPSTGEDERVAVLLSRLDAVCCILAIVDGPMPTKQELGMAYDELVSVRDDVAGIIRHLPAPSHSDVEQLLDDCLLYLQSAEKNIQDHSPFAGTPWHDRLKKLIGQLYERKYKMTTATKGSE